MFDSAGHESKQTAGPDCLPVMYHAVDAKKPYEDVQKSFEPLTTWLEEIALRDKIEVAIVSRRVITSSAILVPSSNAKAKDPSQDSDDGSKPIIEINPRHPVIKELLRKVEANKEDKNAFCAAQLLFNSAVPLSGQVSEEKAKYNKNLERVLHLLLDLKMIEATEHAEEQA
uniref:Uncharacterized protein n=1 Tax=Panagrolaimus sp. JU765 TaxID=591449 RepID=A0AC34R0F3_9BILA